MVSSPRWTEEEIETLLRLKRAKTSTKVIARLLNRTPCQVNTQYAYRTSAIRQHHKPDAASKPRDGNRQLPVATSDFIAPLTKAQLMAGR